MATIAEQLIVLSQTKNNFKNVFDAIGINYSTTTFRNYPQLLNDYFGILPDGTLTALLTAGGELPTSPWTQTGLSNYTDYTDDGYIHIKSTNSGSTTNTSTVCYYEVQNVFSDYEIIEVEYTAHAVNGLNNTVSLRKGGTAWVNVNLNTQYNCIRITNQNNIEYFVLEDIDVTVDHTIKVLLKDTLLYLWVDGVQYLRNVKVYNYTGSDDRILFGCPNHADNCDFYVKDITVRVADTEDNPELTWVAKTGELAVLPAAFTTTHISGVGGQAGSEIFTFDSPIRNFSGYMTIKGSGGDTTYRQFGINVEYYLDSSCSESNMIKSGQQHTQTTSETTFNFSLGSDIEVYGIKYTIWSADASNNTENAGTTTCTEANITSWEVQE